MDTSAEYIRMCEKAIEIQNSKDILKQNCYVIDKNIAKEYLITNIDHSVPHVLQFVSFTKIKNKDIYIFLSNLPPGVISCNKWKTFIWLPRQDQLQDMLDKDVQLDITTWDDRGCPIDFTYDDFINGKVSWEKLWLMFVMYELYKKLWNGTDWIKQQEAK